MPGIFGCISRKGDAVDRELAVEMAGCMRHEKWYVVEWILDQCLLGAVELEFLRKKGSLIYLGDKSVIGVSKGSIFSKQENSERHDPGFIVEAYRNEGFDFAKNLNGLFAAAIYNRENDRIVIANDRYGYYPLFYSFNSNNFTFASEVKAVLKDKTVVPTLDKSAVPEFFALSFLLGDKTFFGDVKKLPPACVLSYDRKEDRIRIKRYWDFSKKRYDATKPLGEYLREFSRLMRHAVEMRVKDRERVGIFLSAGLDSRVLAAFASKTKTPVITFTFGTKNCSEREIASEVAERLGLENIFLEIPSDFIQNYAEQIVYRGDGLIRIRDCHFIACLNEVRERVDTVLLGTFGGDLVWPWTLSNRLTRLRQRKEVINYLFRFYTSSVLPVSRHRKAFSDVFFRQTEGMLERNFFKTFDEIRFSLPADVADYWEYRNREPNYIFQTSQYMNWYLETRHPFMDNELVDFFALRFPPNLRRKEMFGMAVEDTFLQRAISHDFPSLSDMPWHDFPPDPSWARVLVVGARTIFYKEVVPRMEKLLRTRIRPNSVDYRGYEDWLRTGSKNYALSLLLDPKTLERNFFRKDFVANIVKEHMTCRESYDQLICDIINFELLNRIFLDRIDK